MCWCVNSDSAKKGQIFVDILFSVLRLFVLNLKL